MIDHVLRFTLPAAYSLLPETMQSRSASALLLTIGLQESRFLDRRQKEKGPARGFWQFERAGGIAGVIKHPASAEPLARALQQLRYDHVLGNPSRCWQLVEDNDTLACVFARLLLWTLPEALPSRAMPHAAFQQYLDAWRPGKPHPETWDAFYEEAWGRVADLRGVA
jgi:hypothetical protein